MQLFNQALERSGQPDNYTHDEINAYANDPNSKYYPNTNWLKYYFHNGPIQSHTLTLSGANDVSDYYVSIGYQNQKALLKIYDYDRYNALFNYNTKVTKWAKIGTNMNIAYQNTTTPVQTNSDLMLEIMAQAPTFAPFLPDGSGRRANKDYADNGVPNRTVDEAYLMGQNTNIGYNLNAQAYLDINILKGLDWKTTGSIAYYDQNYKSRYIPVSETVYAFQPDSSGNYIATDSYSLGNYLWQQAYRSLTTMVNSIFNYTKDFGADHHLKALLGYEQVEDIGNTLQGYRVNYLNNLNEIDAGPSDGQATAGNTSEDALQSFFGRVNYNYKEKYFVEGDFRYDGTSKLNPKYRWGTFGGGSAAWRISEEKFIKDNVKWINELKLRASYGSLGNQNIATYAYQAVLSNTQYNVNGALAPGVVLTALPANDLKWETTTTTDLGLDLTIFKGLLGATFDWYNKNTTGILAQEADLPMSVGLTAPTINAGTMQNRGVELELTHQNHIGQFNYGVNFLISVNHNKVTKILAPTPGVFQTGLPWNSFYLYKMDGIFQSQDEINNSPAQPNSGVLQPGDIKIADVNHDGQITPDDRVSINPYPAYTYSFGLNAGYKGFKLSAFFQGVQGQKVLVNNWGVDPFLQGTAPTLDFLKNAWTPDNHSNTTPALYLRGYPGVAGYTSTYYLRDASYLRLKDINISYTFSQSLLKASWIKELTLYVSGSNLLTFTPFKDGDPERTAGIGGSSPAIFAQYPQVKIISGGLKITLQ
jgi:TonB-linked SusC/RagA family outer membrane protein